MRTDRAAEPRVLPDSEEFWAVLSAEFIAAMLRMEPPRKPQARPKNRPVERPHG